MNCSHATAASLPILASRALTSAPACAISCCDRLVRRGFALIISREADLEIVGEASDGREAVTLIESLRPDVAVLDVTMPQWNGMECARRVSKSCPLTRVLALSMHRDAHYVREMLRAGARGYLLKDSEDEELLTAIRAVARGEACLSPAIADAVLTDYRRPVSDPILYFARSTSVHGCPWQCLSIG